MSREHVEQFKAVTLRLHAAIESHGLESPEAEALRDESDPIWHAMTEPELDEVRAWAAKFDRPTESSE